MRVILVVAALFLVAVPAVFAQCTAETDPTTGIEWGAVADGVTDMQDCPGGVGQASRLCSGTAYGTPDYSACKCAEETVNGIVWPETAADGNAVDEDCPDSGVAHRVCSSTTLIWETADISACVCSGEADSGITWDQASPSATAQSKSCPGGVGTATRVCSTTSLTWDASDTTACKCAAETVTGISWAQADPDDTPQNLACPGGVGTASRACSSTTLDWDDPDTTACECAAEALTGISWTQQAPSATAQSQNCPGGVGTATRVCSTTTLNWAAPTTSACRCGAEEDSFGIDWTEATPSATAQSKACPGGVGTATRVCSTTTLDWADPVVTACKCAADTDDDTGIVWPETAADGTEAEEDCPSSGTATRVCSDTTLDWDDPDTTDCQCADGEYRGISWATTDPGSNDTNDCPDSNTTASRFCSDVTLDWDEPDFSECLCAEDVISGFTFNQTAVNGTFSASCPDGDDGTVTRYCNGTTATWDDPVEDCSKDSPASTVAMPAALSFAVLVTGWFAMH